MTIAFSHGEEIECTYYYRKGVVPPPLKLEPIPKWDFYKAVETPDHILTIQTGDLQRFANVLLSVGIRTGQ